MEDKFLEQEHTRWQRDRGDETRLLQYKLDDSSVVFDCGGYLGQWASEIFELYKCKIDVFEPLSEYQEIIKQRFINNEKITLHDCGVASEDRHAKIYLQADGSSEFLFQDDSSRYEMAKLKRLSDVIAAADLKDDKIDLLKMNIEGAEYEVIIDLINSGKISSISNLLVQFHSEDDGIKNAVQIRKDIHSNLKKTHKLSWNYEFCWESWERK